MNDHNIPLPQKAEMPESKGVDKYGRLKTSLTILGIFALAVILICGVVFLYGYKDVYDDNAGAGYIPPSFAMVFYYFIIANLAVAAAIVIKCVCKKRASILSLLLTAVLLPILCYQLNYHAFKKDGIMYPLVDEGGMLRFITIQDFNFDGMNDEEHHLRYDERRFFNLSSLEHDVIKSVRCDVVGMGLRLEHTHCNYQRRRESIMISLQKDDAEYKSISVTLTFHDPETAENISFYLDDKKLEHTLNENDTVTLTFDAETCASWQKTADKYYIEVYIKYVLN